MHTSIIFFKAQISVSIYTYMSCSKQVKPFFLTNSCTYIPEVPPAVQDH